MNCLEIVIADDHPIVLSAIKDTIKTKEGWRIIGEAGNGFDLLNLIRRLTPDIAIIDLEMPMMKGYETIAEISLSYPEIKTIALSGFLNEANRQRAIEAGASATVSKSNPLSDVLKAIEKVAQGREYHSPGIPFIDEKPFDETKNAVLTSREKQILKLIAKGQTSKDISDICNISQWTVDRHRANIRAKLGLKNVAEMVRYALKNGYAEN